MAIFEPILIPEQTDGFTFFPPVVFPITDPPPIGGGGGGNSSYSTADLAVENLPRGTVIVPEGAAAATDEGIRELGNMLDEGSAGSERYKLVYSGHAGAYTGTNVYVHYAYSSDGVTWTKGGRVITARALEDPRLVKHDGTYYLYAEDKGDTPFRNIRLYTSTDFETWSDEGDVLDIGTGWEGTDVSSPVVFVENDTFYMLYEGRNPTSNYGEIGLATSSDGINWTKEATNPVFENSEVTNADEIVCDDVLKSSDNEYVLLYHARLQSDGDYFPRVAKSSDLLSWTPLPDASAVVANLVGFESEVTFAPIGSTIQFFYVSNDGDSLDGVGGGIRLAEEGLPVVFKSNFSGADSSTSFDDESPYDATLTANGNVQIQSNSAEFDGTGDFISIADSERFKFRDNDFTVELFGVDFDADTGYQSLFSAINPSNWSFDCSYRGDLSPKRLRLLGYQTAVVGSATADANFTPTPGVKYDICFERKGNTVRIYVDGSMVASSNFTITLYAAAGQTVRIGADNFSGTPGQFLDGSIDAIRVTKNRAVYATDSNYTVPSLPI